VKLTTYVKSFGVWLKDPEGMICKVAEAQNVRDSFPTLIGGMYLREEIESDDFQRLVNQEVKRPAFNGPTPPRTEVAAPAEAVTRTAEGVRTPRKRPTMVEQPLDPLPSVPQDAQANPTAAPLVSDSSTVPPTPPANETPGEKELRELNDALTKLCADGGVTEEQVMAHMRSEKYVKPHHKRPPDLSTTMLKGYVRSWQANMAEMTARIKKVNEVKA
jgi:hypothetical protein